ncbi:MAG: right-handed parallel beta-helix repeat-containing protein [Thermoplasmata archaeon]|nr:MAG: right-handed parallel beta-helix repeat-containing protein [Thermoplasmata archaeon]
MKIKSIIIEIVILLLVACFFRFLAFESYVANAGTDKWGGNTLYVGGNGDGNYSSIQAAINAADSGDTVFVYEEGAPYEEVILIDKTLNLTGEDRNTTVINTRIPIIDIISVRADWVNITGFTITGNNRFSNSGIVLRNARYCKIFNNNVHYNRYSFILESSSNNNIIAKNSVVNNSVGIYLDSISDNDILGNNISSNILFGIYSQDSTNINIMNNTFCNSRALNSYCIYLNRSYDNKIAYNLFINNIYCVFLENSSNNNITYNDCISFDYGIYLDSSTQNTISHNLIRSKAWMGLGLWLVASSNNSIFNNNIVDNGQGMLIDQSSNNNLIFSNKGSDNQYSFCIWYHSINNVAFNNNFSLSGVHAIYIDTASYNNISNNIAMYSYNGIYISKSSNNSISNNLLSNNDCGIQLWSRGEYNYIVGNTIIGNDNGIILDSWSDHNLITDNNISSNSNRGIYITSESRESSITSNEILDNGYGIYISSSSINNTFVKNKINSNSEYGIYINGSENNTIYCNNLIDNQNQAFDDSPLNFWNITYPIGGNYWSDYNGDDNYKGPNQDVQGEDGIGDLPYMIDSDSMDKYPLKEPIIDTLPLEIRLISPENNSIIQPGVILDFHIYNAISIGFSPDGGSEHPLEPPYDISTTGWTDGRHEVRIKAVDSNENFVFKTFFFTIDSLNPTIFLNFPINNSEILGGTILDFSITDSNLMHVNHSINKGACISLSEPFDISTEGWPDGDYAVQINALDIAGNSKSSLFLFTIISSVDVINQAPIAYLDKIEPNPAIKGETVSFTGHGYDKDGIIESYFWASDIHGKLSFLDSFTTSSLSAGTHVISFRVKDDQGTWSENVTANLVIESIPDDQAPIAYIDSISPNPAVKGETITFTGHGIDDGIITSYLWESDIDGCISTDASFSLSTLNIGEHVITFRVRDDTYLWSESVTATLIIEEDSNSDDDGSIEPDKKEEAIPTIILLEGIVLVIIIAIVIIIITLLKKGQSKVTAMQVSCPGCGNVFEVTSLERPLQVRCSNCGLCGLLNR